MEQGGPAACHAVMFDQLIVRVMAEHLLIWSILKRRGGSGLFRISVHLWRWEEGKESCSQYLKS